MSLGLMFGQPSESDAAIMRAFQTARVSNPQSNKKWRDAAQAFFASLSPFQRDVLGEILSHPRHLVETDTAHKELIRLGHEWRCDRICDVDWVTRTTWPLE